MCLELQRESSLEDLAAKYTNHLLIESSKGFLYVSIEVFCLIVDVRVTQDDFNRGSFIPFWRFHFVQEKLLSVRGKDHDF